MTEATGGVAIPVEPYGWLRHPLRALRRQRRARERWRQFAPIADEVVTPADAARVGLDAWFARFLAAYFPGSEGGVRAARLEPFLFDPALEAVVAATADRRAIARAYADVTEARLALADAVTAGVADDGILALPVANGSGELAVGDLLPHAATPLVRRLLGWDGRRRSAEPLRRVLARAAARRADEAALAAFGDKAVDVEVARDAGACDAATAARLAARFGDAARVTVADLLPLAHDPSVRRLIDWRLMLAGAASS
jgi:hypothetical protein